MEVLPPSTNVEIYNSSLKELDFDYWEDSEINPVVINGLSHRLERELKSAKHTHLTCGEVLLPCDLLQRISLDILLMAECEPCGLRGCTIYLNFDDENSITLLSTFECDPTTPSTFEVYLTIKQSTAGWNSFLPQFLKKITRGGTVMISPEYKLTKNKLYRSYVE